MAFVSLAIGVNLGDIIVEDNDIYGEGVNVAARIESVAKPGGVAVSGSVRDNVGSRLDLTFEDTGEQMLKNIERPVRVYNVNVFLGTAPAQPGAANQAKTEPAAPEKPSIAVLPFNNMSGDPEQEYFSDGITEDIITDLSKISGLSVIARNSVFTYKGKPIKVQQAAQELGVKFIVEGSVRKSGQRVRITGQLVDGKDGVHLWADRYDRDLTDIFALQDEITHTIVGQLKVKLLPEEKKVIEQAGLYTLPEGAGLSPHAYQDLPATRPTFVRQGRGIGSPGRRVYRRRKGEALFPEREPITTLEEIRKEIGSAVFSAQYQQNPVPPDGNRLRWEWFGTYDERPPRPFFQTVAQSWDTGLKAEPTSDFSCCTTWGFRERNWYLLDVYRARLDYSALKRKVRELREQWRADRVVVELANTGYALCDEFRNERLGPLEAYTPRDKKETRLEVQAAKIESGMVLIPREADWLPAFKRELLAFPKGHYDDQVDSMTQFLEWSGRRRGRAMCGLNRGRPTDVERPFDVARPDAPIRPQGSRRPP